MGTRLHIPCQRQVRAIAWPGVRFVRHSVASTGRRTRTQRLRLRIQQTHITGIRRRKRDPISGSWYAWRVRVIAKRTLRKFWVRHPKAKGPLEAWHQEAVAADWTSPMEIRACFRSASFLTGNRVVFNIAGNHYRLIVKINYPYRIIYIRFIGTHADYDTIDATTI